VSRNPLLSELARLRFPETPALAAAVRRRIERERRRRRLLAAALTVLAVASTAVAVPPSRSALSNWLHLGGVSIERREELPAAVDRPLSIALGPPVRLREAARRLGLPPVRPPRGSSRVISTHAAPGIAVFVIRWHGTLLLLTEIAYGDIDVIKKVLGPGTRLEPVVVAGGEGYWLTGAPHVLEFQRPSGRLATLALRIRGQTLIWRRGDLTVRVEGQIEKAAALRLARELMTRNPN
jgi:hypothetical protein